MDVDGRSGKSPTYFSATEGRCGRARTARTILVKRWSGKIGGLDAANRKYPRIVYRLVRRTGINLIIRSAQ